MAKIIRSEEQIRALLGELTEEMNSLPAYNAFNESNEETIKEMKGWIRELEVALETGTVPDNDDSEAVYWLTNERSYFGKDYGVT